MCDPRYRVLEGGRSGDCGHVSQVLGLGDRVTLDIVDA